MNPRRTTLALASLFVLAGCASEKTTLVKDFEQTVEIVPPAVSSKPARLISRDVLFANPERASLRLSPDGKTVSWLAPVDGVLNIWVAPADNPAQSHPITRDDNRGIRQYFWAANATHIVYLQDRGGDENFRAYSVDVETGEEINLTPFDGVRAQIQQTSREHPDEILIGLNNRTPQLHDSHRVNVTTGEREMVFKNDQFVGFTTDREFNVRFASQFRPDGGVDIFELKPDGSTELFMEVSSGDSLTTGLAGFSGDLDRVYLFDSRERDTAALYLHDLDTNESELIYENPKADVSDLLIDPETHMCEGASANYTRVKWEIFDDGVANDFEVLRGVEDGDINVLSRTNDDTKWAVAYTLDKGPVKYYVYDRSRQRAEYLFSNRPALDGLRLSAMHPRVIEARDGLKLVSYLTLPAWTDPDENGVPDEALPMVLLVHGGPWARDSWGYNSWHQWLSNRGYAVLSVNYRGSTGFGKEFTNAGNFEWAGKMHDDLLDAKMWAVRNGITTDDQVAIAGGSYGGYATLVGLTFTPEEFACGVDIVGPSNINTLLESIPPYWAPAVALFTSRVGDHRTPEGREFLESRSPLTFVDNIERPLLIGQGANDPRVKQAEADQIVEAMQRKGLPVTYVLYPDEGHGFARPENSKSFNATMESFLAQHLGGRVEPIGDDFDGSTISVPVGAEEVPGLVAALEEGEG